MVLAGDSADWWVAAALCPANPDDPPTGQQASPQQAAGRAGGRCSQCKSVAAGVWEG
jgi:hypothetical protein